MKLSQRLFNELKHGDQEHQDWLENKINEFFEAEKQKIIDYYVERNEISPDRRIPENMYLYMNLSYPMIDGEYPDYEIPDIFVL